MSVGRSRKSRKKEVVSPESTVYMVYHLETLSRANWVDNNLKLQSFFVYKRHCNSVTTQFQTDSTVTCNEKDLAYLETIVSVIRTSISNSCHFFQVI